MTEAKVDAYIPENVLAIGGSIYKGDLSAKAAVGILIVAPNIAPRGKDLSVEIFNKDGAR